MALVTAVTVVAELGTLSRFESPRQLMGYSDRGIGLGLSVSTLARRISQKTTAGRGAGGEDIAWKAQCRLHARYLQPV